MQPFDPVFLAGLEQLTSVCVKLENNFWRGAMSYFVYGYPVYTVFKVSQDKTRNDFYEGRKKKRSPDGNCHLLYAEINILSRYRTLYCGNVSSLYAFLLFSLLADCFIYLFII